MTGLGKRLTVFCLFTLFNPRNNSDHGGGLSRCSPIPLQGMHMETRDEEKREITEKFITRAIEGHRAHDLDWKRIPGFNVSVLEEDAINRSCFYSLSMAVIFQGEKVVDVGDNQYQYGGGSMIVTSVEVPTSYRILNASSDRPFVSASIKLDRALLAEIMGELSGKKDFPASEDNNAFCVAKTPVEISDCFLRLLRLADHPEDMDFVFPCIQRELHYFALTDPQCGNLRELCTGGLPSNRVSKAVEWLKQHYKEPIRIQELADMVYMSSSTFHNHFKNVTSLTPLQYQKRLRLHEAKRLMISEAYNASSAAFEVGYESVQQFNREYKRLFGKPPVQDVSGS